MQGFLPLAITKMSGAGNTFALIDARRDSAWVEIEQKFHLCRPEFARTLCHSVSGIGVDGLLFLQSGSSGFDFDWDFYNSDGSTAEMCGNAARCAARFCRENLGDSEKSQLRFKTGAGLITTEAIEGGKIRVKMPEAKFLQKEISLKTKSSSVEKFALVNTGVPHLVQKIHDMSDISSLKDMAKEARSHHDLQPAGANVTFFAELSASTIKAVTFERGVEDYTLACGTGAVAAAFVHSEGSGIRHVEVQMPGGILQVLFLENDPCPLMTGEAIFIGEFRYNLEVIK